MDFGALLFKILLALGLGGLIGIDRERVHRGYPGGIRTLAFFSLLGMLSSFIAHATLNDWVMPVSVASVFLLVVVGYDTSRSNNKSFGLTSTIVLLLTYLIGLISYFDDYQYLAVALAIITTLILTEKEILHNFARKMKTGELLDALKFGIVAFVILPLLPNQSIDPLGVINPYNLWLMVVLILGISFAGYIAGKFLGAYKGVFWSGVLGGLISSTAVASSLSIISRKSSKLLNSCAAGITVAASIMFLRILLEAYIFNPELSYSLIIPLVLSAVTGIIISFTMSRGGNNTNARIIHESPFNFIPALKFTALLAVILLVSKLGNDFFGQAGTFITSTLAGFVDTDAITLSMASLSGAGISYTTGSISILLVCITNTLVKLFIAASVGGKELLKKVIINFGLMIIPLIIFIFLIF
ncbi:hypothetical protein COS83_01885 [archaeon CG07_land_8_20_14_0_80_38_8]|nr:MAG: hypothetical protein COS83_01885 [archaeon CG07_land_8_20_14_0_80_38_8]